MKKLGIVTFAAILLAVSSAPSFAASSGMHGSMMQKMPSCKAGDPMVGVNMKTKMYMTHDQMKAKMAGMSKDKMHMMMTKNHVKLMCKSQADSMGGKMMSTSHM
jgi:hypothetical protein